MYCSMRTGHLSAPVHSRGSFQNTTAWDTVVDCDRNFGCLYSVVLRPAFRILGFQMDLLCTGWYPFLYVGIYWVYACPLSRSRPQLYNILESHDNTPSAHAIYGYSHQPVGTPPVKTATAKAISLRRQLFILFFFIIVFTTYFLYFPISLGAVFTYTYIS